MNTYNFIYGGIEVEVTISDAGALISFLHPNMQNVTVQYEVGDYTRKRKQRQIIVFDCVKRLIHTNGEILNSRILKSRTYTDSISPLSGQRYYTFFYNLATGAEAQGSITDKALINEQLENLLEYFDKPIYCFNPANSWQFVPPIYYTLNTETPNFLSVENLDNTRNILIKIYNENSLFVDWTSNFTNVQLPAGQYSILVRDHTANFTMYPESFIIK